ncbi:MAG: Rieske 2Fe-2S domain-containing protein [Conexivisphaerales archaeon]
MFKRIGISSRAFERRNSLITWVDGKPILIAKHNANYYALNAVCAHMGCALLTDVNGNIAICPAHGAKYDITTGAMIEKPQVRPEVPCEYSELKIPLTTYKVRETPQGPLEIDV